MNKIDGLLVKQRRKELGMSQADLAEKMGVSKVAVCWYENGDRTPTFDNFIRLSEILDVSLNALAGREVRVVSSDNEDYSVMIPKQKLVILEELEKYPKIYKALYRDPARACKLIDKRMR